MQTSRRALFGAFSAPFLLGATNKSGSKRPVVGADEHTYEVIHDWGDLPAGLRYGNTHGIVEDSQGRIYVHHTVHVTSENHDSMVVFDAAGKFIKSWGKEFQGGAHGLHIQKEGSTEFLYLCDTSRAIVQKTTLDGEPVWTLGYPEESDAYRPGSDGKRLKYSPTNLAISPNGDVYVGDGYGSSYINRYSKDGSFLGSFGGKGSGPGQLDCPHGMILDTRSGSPKLLVADRGNNRLQYFSLDGQHLGFAGGTKLPCHFSFFANGDVVIPDLGARVTLLDKSNQVITHLGDDSASDAWKTTRKLSRDNFTPGKFICPHGACFDHAGNIFVVEWVEIGRVTKLRKV